MDTINRERFVKLRLRAVAGLALAIAAVFGASIAYVEGQDTNAPVAPTKPIQATSATPAEQPKRAKPTGAELYQINCNRCHAERYPTEFSPGQWKTILTHMRVRANLPAAQAREILKYLQEDSGN